MFLVLAGVLGGAACGDNTERGSPSVDEVEFVVSAFAPGQISDARLDRTAEVVETRTRMLTGRAVEGRWDRKGGGRVYLSGLGPFADDRELLREVSRPGRLIIRPRPMAVGDHSYASLYAAASAASSVEFTPSPAFDPVHGVTRRYRFGPAPERVPLVRVTGTADMLSETVRAAFPGGVPDGSVSVETPQGLLPYELRQAVGAGGATASQWFLAAVSLQGFRLGPRRVALVDSPDAPGARTLTYPLTAHEREVLDRDFGVPQFDELAGVGRVAALMLDDIVIGAAEAGQPGSPPQELVFDGIGERDAERVVAAAFGPIPWFELTPVS